MYKVIIAALALSLASCGSKPETSVAQKSKGFTFGANSTANDTIGYALGAQFGNLAIQYKMDKYFTDESLLQGLHDVLEKKPFLIHPEIGLELANSKMAEKYKGNIDLEKAYLNKISGEKDVVTLPSGLRYRIIKAAKGPKPALSSTVKVHYHGMLKDGTVFDSSVAKGAPIEFSLNGVIKGWTEGLQLMPLGSKWEFFIPSNLGYGAKGAGTIPPHSPLHFEVELLEIK